MDRHLGLGFKRAPAQTGSQARWPPGQNCPVALRRRRVWATITEVTLHPKPYTLSKNLELRELSSPAASGVFGHANRGSWVQAPELI